MTKEQQTCTNAKQSKKLIELGLREDTADLYITKGTISNKKTKDAVPAWSLSKMVEIVSHYLTPHPELWRDVDFFTEIYNELCHALVNGSCWDYWSDEKRAQEKDPQRNHWSKYAEAIREKLPIVFQCKTPKGQELIDFYEMEGNDLRHRDDRLGRIYRHTAKVLKEYEDMKRKPKCMLSWSRNTSGKYLVSLWALNDKGEGCFEYGVEYGTTKLSALWGLFKRLRRQRQAHLLRYIKKQEYHGNGLEDYKKKHFKIKKVSDNYYIIRQRHTLLFFIHFYDDGAELLCPNYRAEKDYQARDLIGKTAREVGFDYVIHD
jgi:hypothetical protein